MPTFFPARRLRCVVSGLRGSSVRRGDSEHRHVPHRRRVLRTATSKELDSVAEKQKRRPSKNLMQEMFSAWPPWRQRPVRSRNDPKTVVTSKEKVVSTISTKKPTDSTELVSNQATLIAEGFNWESCKSQWYLELKSRAKWLSDLGFTIVWLPPPTDSVSGQGYLPRDLYCLDSAYGSHRELRDCIATFQEFGMRVLGDVVLNHRCAHYQDEHGVWNRFGGKLAWDQRAIVCDDPNFRGRGHRSSGEVFAAAPNIDHQQQFVRDDLSEWLLWLRDTAGFNGWRLDFVRGFSGKHILEYMQRSKPHFAVGEFWDSLAYSWEGLPEHNQNGHRQRIVNWINQCGGLCTAFDVTTKGILHSVFDRCEFWRLRDDQGKPPGLVGWWPSRSVTFLENHDTGSTQGHWRFPEHGLEPGYAYILTHPGTPCVFYDHVVHWNHLVHPISRLIALRRQHDIHCRSSVKIHEARQEVYVAEIDRKLLVKIGPGEFRPSGNWRRADNGHWWCVWSRS